MNTPNFELDSDTQQLLKKSLRSTTADFTEQLMQRILLAEPIKVKTLRNLKFAWLAGLASLVFVPFVSYFFTTQLPYLFPYFKHIIEPNMQLITPATVLFFAMLVLLRIEQIIQLSINRNNAIQRFD